MVPHLCEFFHISLGYRVFIDQPVSDLHVNFHYAEGFIIC